MELKTEEKSTWYNPYIGSIAAIVVIAVNSIVNAMNEKLCKFARYKTESESQTALASYHFYFIFLNAALIPLIVSIRIGSFIPTHFIAGIFPGF